MDLYENSTSLNEAGDGDTSPFNHGALQPALGALGFGRAAAPGQLMITTVGNGAKTQFISGSPHHLSPELQVCSILATQQKRYFSQFLGFVKLSFHKNECSVMLSRLSH